MDVSCFLKSAACGQKSLSPPLWGAVQGSSRHHGGGSGGCEAAAPERAPPRLACSEAGGSARSHGHPQGQPAVGAQQGLGTMTQLSSLVGGKRCLRARSAAEEKAVTGSRALQYCWVVVCVPQWTEGCSASLPCIAWWTGVGTTGHQSCGLVQCLFFYCVEINISWHCTLNTERFEAVVKVELTLVLSPPGAQAVSVFIFLLKYTQE